MQQTGSVNGKSIYDVGVQELRRVSTDESARKEVESEFTEARGRETARLHVTLKAIDAQDIRSTENSRRLMESIERVSAELQDRAAQLSHLIESFEQMTDRRFSGVHDDLKTRAEALTAQVASLADAERQHFEGIRTLTADFRGAVTAQVNETRTAVANQLDDARAALWKQADANFNATSAQARESTERVVMDVRQARDEVIRLLDSRMNQSDASFAAIRGDLEVVKFLVMDLIKDRIGRHDPKSKPF